MGIFLLLAYINGNAQYANTVRPNETTKREMLVDKS
jgi:hypothetical protein